jgi:hypothetical protein
VSVRAPTARSGCGVRVDICALYAFGGVAEQNKMNFLVVAFNCCPTDSRHENARFTCSTRAISTGHIRACGVRRRETFPFRLLGHGTGFRNWQRVRELCACGAAGDGASLELAGDCRYQHLALDDDRPCLSRTMLAGSPPGKVGCSEGVRAADNGIAVKDGVCRVSDACRACRRRQEMDPERSWR